MPLEMTLSYILIFCRITIAFVFLISSGSKAFDLKHFRQTIIAFGILTSRYSSLATFLLLLSEVTIVLCMLWGGSLLLPGFFLAIGLLVLFCSVLTSVLVRKIRVSCNCFGPNNTPVTGFDILRNGVFTLCALTANGILIGTKQIAYSPSALEWITIGLSTIVFVLFWIGFGDLVRFLFQKEPTW